MQSNTAVRVSPQAAGYVFTPTDKERSNRSVHVRYSATKDQYCRVSNNSEVTQSWDQCVWRKESVFRKVEDDWQMVRLSLFDGQPHVFQFEHDLF